MISREKSNGIYRKNYLAFGLDSHLSVNNIIELFLKLNGESLWQPNEIMMHLRESDKKFLEAPLFCSFRAERHRKVFFFYTI
jgi:hypothetical protein